MLQPLIQSPAAADESELIRLAVAGERQAIRKIIKTHNQRLYRLVRAIVRNNGDAEDVLQEAYLRAFASLGEFHGDSSLSTWLSRIAINAALMRLRGEKRQKRSTAAEQMQGQLLSFPHGGSIADPEKAMAQRQILNLVEQATDALPEAFRLVFVARVIEGLSVEETAAALGVPEATVKTRLHRARKLVKADIEARIGPVAFGAFPFAGARCDRLTDAVMAKLNS